ncbi:N-acetylated-alpha-linked acidic dipeptidase 2 [Decorospora gaudefroyi]|uniref:N-acetylated-alpha-linked acidic dipeptidase 2 n=1 Tax=Decorospora gaudefroyi TaxID=184978 RepID=A0A6A5K498_9PLEO|nr:N-acetylated-alpha-linked acidic dipeptidase 2 [Decorospora gaudefroyi]
MKSTAFFLAAAAAAAVHACDKEHHFRHHERHLHVQQPRSQLDDIGASKRVFPPALTAHERVLIDSFDNTTVASWSRYYTHKRNLAGESDIVPKWTAERWGEYGFETRLDSYYVYLDYPVHQSLALHYGNGSMWEASLEEEVLEEDETTGYSDRVPAFHGYSGSGNVSAEYVYVGRGSQQDFHRLQSLGITLAGKIALAKYGGPFRGLKVKNAQAVGMIGAILFTDPGDDKTMIPPTYPTYPHGPARNPTSIQRGSVVDLSAYPGDPTTPGYPSKEGSERADTGTIPRIPSLPLSWVEARPLLVALNGCGVDAETVGRSNWVGGIEGVEYSSGPSGARVSMRNMMRGEMKWIHNTVGIVNGTDGDEVVIVGNHHDAWMIGGAADPHSGSAILVETARAIGALLKTGWKPKRTIVLCSWDAEEYGLVGSTEWVEEYIPWLKDSVVSYLNIDVGVAGTIPDFGASPDLHALTTATAQKVIWPHGNNRTVYDAWEEKAGEIDGLGAQSDYAAFVHRAGIASIDMGTTRAPTDPIYHSHSNFDSFHWMTTFADPGFVMHKSIGQFLTLMLFHLVDDEVLPLEPANYGVEMRAWFQELEQLVSEANATADVQLSALDDAVSVFEDSAREFNGQRAMANSSAALRAVNHKARDFGRAFIGQGGLPGRDFFQHLIFAPGIDTGYRPVMFPGVTEQVAAGKLALAQEYVGKTAKAVLAAASILRS